MSSDNPVGITEMHIKKKIFRTLNWINGADIFTGLTSLVLIHSHPLPLSLTKHYYTVYQHYGSGLIRNDIEEN